MSPTSDSNAYTLLGVKNELCQLSASLSDSTKECKNYIPVRLVTIIEQFFRVMIVLGRIDRRPDIWNPVSVSTLISIFEHCGKPQSIDDNYGETIRVFCKGDDKRCKYDTKTNNVRFLKDHCAAIDDLVLGVLKEPNPNVSKWINAQTQSFQNVKAIECYAANFLDTKKVKQYMELFDTRHNLVHTLNGVRFDASGCFDLVEELFAAVESENP